MSEIQWLGCADHWEQPKTPAIPKYLMPLTEEAVLDVAFSASPLPKISISSAIACTSRLALRVALAGTTLNPKWHPFNWEPCVIKAPASCLNQGVRFLPSNEYITKLARFAPDLGRVGVVEEFVSGEAWQLDGCVINGRIKFFHPLRQTWNSDYTKILGYERGIAPGVGLAMRKAIQSIGLNNSPFCAELRLTPGDDWKIIEIHARLGEDEGLANAMWDSSPIQQIEAWAEALKQN